VGGGWVGKVGVGLGKGLGRLDGEGKCVGRAWEARVVGRAGWRAEEYKREIMMCLGRVAHIR
jgi:hypothetical protein